MKRIASLIVLLVLLLSACQTYESRPFVTVPDQSCPLGAERCPNPGLTPGAVVPGGQTAANGCPPGAPARDPRRQLTVRQEAQDRAQYGLDPDSEVAEFDHLIAWWAGGRSSLENVWPMRNTADKKRKDLLEDRLFRKTCQTHPTMTLATARDEMQHFWKYW